MMHAGSKRKTREEILELSVALFSEFGFDGVSMRDVAAVTGLTPAALYYHFPDKENLYLNVVAHEFREKATYVVPDPEGPEPPWSQLETFVTNLARVAAQDAAFLRLMQWVRIDSDEARQQNLATYVFKDLFNAIHDLVARLHSRFDAHMLAMSIVGLVLFYSEGKKVRRFMPGYKPEHDDPDVLARHIVNLLRSGVSEPPATGKGEADDIARFTR